MSPSLLQSKAEAAGRRCAVGALIDDDDGRIFVHRRGWDRGLFPGCWDLVGGHVEPGENLAGALAREVHEETGWVLVGEPTLVVTWEWHPPAAPQEVRREFDFLVQVDGDLARPRLEHPKHVEHAWVGPADLSLLDEHRADGDPGIRPVVETALRRLAEPRP